MFRLKRNAERKLIDLLCFNNASYFVSINGKSTKFIKGQILNYAVSAKGFE